MRSGTADLVTARGVVHIRTHCSLDLVSGLALDEGIGVFPHYRSIVRDMDSLKRIAAIEGANLILAYTDEGKVIGFLALSNPSPLERWGRDSAVPLYELGAIEVSQNWRRLGIANKMAELAVEDEEVEDRILFLTGFSWHWDLEQTGLTKMNYRRMLMSIFEPFGFRHFYTTEGNVNMDSANMLMARIGSRVSAEDQERFLDLLFALPQAEEVF